MINPLTKKPYVEVKRRCLRCGERVYESDIKEYPFVCLTCDENKFTIEVSETDFVERIWGGIDGT